MFWGSTFNQDLSQWNTSQVTTMRSMFYGAAFNQDLSQWKTSQVTDMSYMFYGAAFDRTLCGGAWESLRGSNGDGFAKSAFDDLGLGTSTARLGCCKAGQYIVDPHTPASVYQDNNCDKCALKLVKNADPQCCPDNLHKCQISNGACRDAECNSVVCDGGYGYNNTTNGCESCPSGKFQYGGDTCESCHAGLYQNSVGQGTCKSCPAGLYQNVVGQGTCKSCHVGLYQNVAGQDTCKSCGNDSTSKPGATEISDCFLVSSIPKSMLKAAYSVGC